MLCISHPCRGVISIFYLFIGHTFYLFSSASPSVMVLRSFFGLSARSDYPVGRIMSDMTSMDMQKKGSAISVFQRIAEVALRDLVVFSLVRVPCDTAIYEVGATLQFGFYSGRTGDDTSTRYRSEIRAHLVFPSVGRTSRCMTCKTTHIKVIKIETC